MKDFPYIVLIVGHNLLLRLVVTFTQDLFHVYLHACNHMLILYCLIGVKSKHGFKLCAAGDSLAAVNFFSCTY